MRDKTQLSIRTSLLANRQRPPGCPRAMSPTLPLKLDKVFRRVGASCTAPESLRLETLAARVRVTHVRLDRPRSKSTPVLYLPYSPKATGRIILLRTHRSWYPSPPSLRQLRFGVGRDNLPQ